MQTPSKGTASADLSNHDYHALPSISKSGLDLIRKSPALYKYRRENPKPPTPAMRFGTLVHTAVLEPDRFTREVVVLPDDAPLYPTSRQWGAKNPSADSLAAMDWWRAFDVNNEGRERITAAEHGELVAIRDSVWSHPFARRLLADLAEVETSIQWTAVNGAKCRCRPDGITSRRWRVDLKTTSDASPEGFAKSVANFRYHVQDAFYTDGGAALEGEASPFVFICVESEPPYLTAVYILTSEARAEGRRQYLEDLDTFKRCLDRGEWPGYSDRVEPLDLPKWAVTTQDQ